MKQRFILALLLLTSLGLQAQSHSWKSGDLKLTIDGQGYVTSLQVGKQELLLGGRQPLFTTCRDNEIIEPFLFQTMDSIFAIKMRDGGGVFFDIKETPAALILEIVSIPDVYDAIMLLPVQICLNETIGELIGVVQGKGIAFGLQALNDKTTAGIPMGYEDATHKYFHYQGQATQISEGVLPSNLHAATATAQGTFLQMHTLRRNALSNGFDHIPSGNDPIEASEGSIKGAKLAIFGCLQKELFNTLEAIEITQNLPHSVIDGTWCKLATKQPSYLITDFSFNDLDLLIEKCNLANWKLVYHKQPFYQLGHYTWSPVLAANDTAMRQITAQLQQHGIELGAIVDGVQLSPTDAFVSPIPSEHLLKEEALLLKEDLDQQQQAFCIHPTELLPSDGVPTTLQIEQELIQFQSIESDQEETWLNGCTRGAHGTFADNHPQHVTTYRLWNAPTGNFYPDLYLQSDMAEALAKRCQQSHLSSLRFNNLEECQMAGFDQYAINRFVNSIHRHAKASILSETTLMTHNTWHAHSRLNMGSADASLSDRLPNLAFYKRNLLPNMLGTFAIRTADSIHESTTPEELEWFLSKATGHDAGYTIDLSIETLRNHGQIDTMLTSIATWDKVRLSGQLTTSQKRKLSDEKSFWHLETISNKSYMLFAVSHIADTLTFNKDETKEWQAPISSSNSSVCINLFQGGSLSNPAFIVGNDTLTLPITLDENQKLTIQYDGSICLTDKNYQLIQQFGKIDNTKAAVIFRCTATIDTTKVAIHYYGRQTPIEITL